VGLGVFDFCSISRRLISKDSISSPNFHESKPLHETNFRDFFDAEVFSWTQNFKPENFMHSEWIEEYFLKGSVGQKMNLCFWNKCQMADVLLTQLANYRHVLARKFEYHL